MKFLLDTNICIALLNGKDQTLIQKVKKNNPTDFVFCSIVKAELVFGARNSQYVEKNLTLLKKFFSQFESLSFDDEAADYYGTIRTVLKRSGTPIGAHDLLIASIAMTHNIILLTRNKKEFSYVPGLRYEVW